MNIVLCGEKCVYQKDGYCNLEALTLITGFTENNACIYFVNRDSKISSHIKNSLINKIQKTL